MKELQELIGATIFNAELHEGKLVINYEQKGSRWENNVPVFPEEKRMVLGFDDSGMWCECNQEVTHGVNCSCNDSCLEYSCEHCGYEWSSNALVDECEECGQPIGPS